MSAISLSYERRERTFQPTRNPAQRPLASTVPYSQRPRLLLLVNMRGESGAIAVDDRDDILESLHGVTPEER